MVRNLAETNGAQLEACNLKRLGLKQQSYMTFKDRKTQNAIAPATLIAWSWCILIVLSYCYISHIIFDLSAYIIAWDIKVSKAI